jgi:hypothetical protein
MGVDQDSAVPRKGGRPARYLLTRIAVCAVCDAPVRVGSQNLGATHALFPADKPSRYRVYECRGSRGGSGFHVSMSQEHLDEIVAEALIVRMSKTFFRVPYLLKGEEARAERSALREAIKQKLDWLEEVRIEAARRGRPRTLARQELLVHPQLRELRERLDTLERVDPLIAKLHRTAPFVGLTWERMPIADQRHVAQALVLPRIHPVPPSERGHRGVNEERVELVWL